MLASQKDLQKYFNTTETKIICEEILEKGTEIDTNQHAKWMQKFSIPETSFNIHVETFFP